MIKKHSRKKGPVVAKRVIQDGINFASGLERYMYLALKKAKIKADYEGQTFVVQEAFNFNLSCYEKQANGKGEYKDRGNKHVQSVKYTPDFIGKDFIIECKGRANESFPMRWKMFKKYVNEHLPHVTLYKPQNQKDCDETIILIQNLNK